jgi:hypothetical protein
MPRYLLLKHYRGGPEPHRPFQPMNRWAPRGRGGAHRLPKACQRAAGGQRRVRRRAGLTPARTSVRYGGPDAAPVSTAGPHPETSDLVAGWWMIDVESHERAVELAAYVSS